MDITLIILILLPIAAMYAWYVAIVSKRNKAQEALSGIDVQLKKRSNLVPNILQIAKKFMEHEKQLLTDITALRERADQQYDQADAEAVKKHLAASEQLGSKMGQLMVSVEDYPELKSNETMLQAMQTYNEVEAQIAAARRFYNASVTSLNNSIQIFPGNLIANLANASPLPFYTADEAAKAPVNANDYLN